MHSSANANTLRQAGRGLAGFILLVVLAGCTPMEWRKDGATPEAMLNDQAACRREAELRVPDIPYMASPGVVAGPSGVTVLLPPATPSPQRQADVELEARRCMQDKGYQLVPK